MKTPNWIINYSFSDAFLNAAMLYGIPVGVCVVGIAVMLMPGMTPFAAVVGWLAVYVGVCLPYLMQSWSSRTGALVLFAASLLTFCGIVLNCHYYICVWGNDDVSSPGLMNLDHWSAWNNALVCIGRDDAMPCPWPAAGYGHLIGFLVLLFGDDISIPLIFNAFCSLFTIAMTGCLAQRCCYGDDIREQRRIASFAMVLTALCCYFIASGAILIKDTPLAASVALTAWGSMRLRQSATSPLASFVALTIAAVIFAFARPIYLLLQIFIVFAIGIRKDRRTLSILGIAVLCIGALCLYQIFIASATSIDDYINFNNRSFSDDSASDSQHSLYYRIFHDYYSLSFWQHLVLLPVTTAIQFLIPLPWNYDKYLMFGPFISYAHLSFGRYAVGGLILYFFLHQIRAPRRAPAMLIRLSLTGLFFYTASAMLFGGTVSRYGIPLIALLVPCAAFAWHNYRRERRFRIYAIAYVLAMFFVLFTCHYFTT